MVSRLYPAALLGAVMATCFLAGLLVEPLLFPDAGALPHSRPAKLAKAKSPALPAAAQAPEAVPAQPEEHTDTAELSAPAEVPEEATPETVGTKNEASDRGQDVDMIGEADTAYEVVESAGPGDVTDDADEEAPAEAAASDDPAVVSDEDQPSGGE